MKRPKQSPKLTVGKGDCFVPINNIGTRNDISLKRLLIFIFFLSYIQLVAEEKPKPFKLVTLDPGHFHAALVQKTMYENVDSIVQVYAPAGIDLQLHRSRINSYNIRLNNPTRWKEQVYTGTDFFERMIADKAGNVVVISGNNKKKTEYILKSLEAGFNVFADKPMVIDSKGFEMLQQAFEAARGKNLLLYDIMTERFEITTILQRELSMLPEIFGELEKGTPENPAITKESVHHFYKYVSGSVLTRPAWFFDVSQEGEGIVDVMTHLVDLVQWECFPEQTIDYTNDVTVTSAKRWTTAVTLEGFKSITKEERFPDFLKRDVVNDTLLQVYCNGEINYQVRGIHAKTSVLWNYKAPEGTGDTHSSIMRGTKANLVIKQSAEENYIPTLYVESAGGKKLNDRTLNKQFETIQKKYPGVELKRMKNGWEVVIPQRYREGHEEHFARVMENFLRYLNNKTLPAWEVPNMIAKYYTTTKALEIAKQHK